MKRYNSPQGVKLGTRSQWPDVLTVVPLCILLVKFFDQKISILNLEHIPFAVWMAFNVLPPPNVVVVISRNGETPNGFFFQQRSLRRIFYLWRCHQSWQRSRGRKIFFYESNFECRFVAIFWAFVNLIKGQHKNIMTLEHRMQGIFLAKTWTKLCSNFIDKTYLWFDNGVVNYHHTSMFVRIVFVLIGLPSIFLNQPQTNWHARA